MADFFSDTYAGAPGPGVVIPSTPTANLQWFYGRYVTLGTEGFVSNDRILFFEIPAGTLLLTSVVTCTDFGSATTALTANVGLYAKDNGAVIDADIFAGAINLQLPSTEQGFQSFDNDATKLAEDAVCEANIALTGTLTLVADAVLEVAVLGLGVSG